MIVNPKSNIINVFIANLNETKAFETKIRTFLFRRGILKRTISFGVVVFVFSLNRQNTFAKRRFLDLSPLRFVSKRFHILDVLSSGQVKDVAVVSAEVETAKWAPFHRNWFAAVNKNI